MLPVPHPRIAGTGEDVGRSLGRLVVALLDAIRQVIERQALRRIDAGDLSEEEVERLGQALMELDTTFEKLADTFGVTPDDLYLPFDLADLLTEGPSTTPTTSTRKAPR